MDDDPIVPTGDDLDEDLLPGSKLPEEEEEEDEDLMDDADESLN